MPTLQSLQVQLTILQRMALRYAAGHSKMQIYDPATWDFLKQHGLVDAKKKITPLGLSRL